MTHVAMGLLPIGAGLLWAARQADKKVSFENDWYRGTMLLALAGGLCLLAGLGLVGLRIFTAI